MAEKPGNQPKPYMSYLLRLWQESGGGTLLGDAPHDPPLWRASLEQPQSGDRLGFASLEDLVAFLEKETGASPPGSQHQDGEGG